MSPEAVKTAKGITKRIKDAEARDNQFLQVLFSYLSWQWLFFYMGLILVLVHHTAPKCDVGFLKSTHKVIKVSENLECDGEGKLQQRAMSSLKTTYEDADQEDADQEDADDVIKSLGFDWLASNDARTINGTFLRHLEEKKHLLHKPTMFCIMPCNEAFRQLWFSVPAIMCLLLCLCARAVAVIYLCLHCPWNCGLAFTMHSGNRRIACNFVHNTGDVILSESRSVIEHRQAHLIVHTILWSLICGVVLFALAADDSTNALVKASDDVNRLVQSANPNLFPRCQYNQEGHGSTESRSTTEKVEIPVSSWNTGLGWLQSTTEKHP